MTAETHPCNRESAASCDFLSSRPRSGGFTLGGFDWELPSRVGRKHPTPVPVLALVHLEAARSGGGSPAPSGAWARSFREQRPTCNAPGFLIQGLLVY